MITAGLVALTMAAGAASVLAVQDTAATLDELSTRSAPLSIAAQQVYRSLSDADATAAQASSAGGQVAVEPFDIPTVGRSAVLMDPQGAMFSVLTPAAQQ